MGDSDLQSFISKSGMGFLKFRAGDEIYLLQVPGLEGTTEIDVGTAAPLELFTKYPQLEQPHTRELLISTAQRMAESGVQARSRGDYGKAFILYRFALFITCHFRLWEGIHALTDNLWMLRQLVKERLRGKARPIGSGLTVALGGDVVIGGGGKNGKKFEEESFLQDMTQHIRFDGDMFLKWIKDAMEAEPQAVEEKKLMALQCLHNAADLAGDARTRQEVFFNLCGHAGRIKRSDSVMMVALQELTHIELTDLLVVNDLIKPPDAEQSDKELKSSFSEVWEVYLAHRQYIDQIASSQTCASFCLSAFSNFEFIRSQTIRGGGAIWHRVSYIVSGYLQIIGHDLCHMLMIQNQSEKALEFSERIHSRSMVDWMARTHPTNRLAANPHMMGSVGEVDPANFEEIRQAARDLNAPLLIYLANPDGFWVCLLTWRGVIAKARIKDPQAIIQQVFQSLPYAASVGMIAGNKGVQRNLSPAQPSSSSADNLDEALSDLYQSLIPPEIASALNDEKGARLAIIADDLLHYVPFCALRTEKDRYLVEDREMIYLPSVTGWMLVKDGIAGFHEPWTSGQSPPSFVMGNPDFTNDLRQQAKLIPLPGTAKEARSISKMLRTKPMLKKDASVKSLFQMSHGVPVVHLATHGVLDMGRPEKSYVAFSDGDLTAGELYQYDPGLRVGLVMMSACQTGLGTQHPDSVIGLSNAFLISGAHTVGSTLWPVEDDITARLMTRFYKELLKGKGPAEALRETQLGIMKKAEWRHPYYWAAFKITGGNSNPLPKDIRQ